MCDTVHGKTIDILKYKTPLKNYNQFLESQCNVNNTKHNYFLNEDIIRTLQQHACGLQ